VKVGAGFEMKHLALEQFFTGRLIATVKAQD
jgi:hypothetical protein